MSLILLLIGGLVVLMLVLRGPQVGGNGPAPYPKENKQDKIRSRHCQRQELELKTRTPQIQTWPPVGADSRAHLL